MVLPGRHRETIQNPHTRQESHEVDGRSVNILSLVEAYTSVPGREIAITEC